MKRGSSCSLVLLALGMGAVGLGCHRRAPPTGSSAGSPAAPTPAPAVATIALERETEIRESGGLVLARVPGEHRIALIADEDDASIVEVDLDKPNAEPRSTPIGARPRDLLLLGDGTIAATLPDANAVATFARDATGGLREVRRAALPTEPIAMGLSPDDKDLYVSTGASHALVALRASSLEEARRWDLPREPRAVLVSREGGRIFVSHAAEGALSVVSQDAVSPRDIGNGGGCGSEGGCTSKRVARHANALVRMGERIVVPAAQVLPKPPRSMVPSKAALEPPLAFGDGPAPPPMGGSISGYGIGDGSSGPPVFMDVTTLDEADGTKLKKKGMMVTSGSSCLIPRAAIAIKDDVFVACLGSNRVEQLKNPQLRPVPSVAQGTSAVPKGPSAIAAERDGARLVVWSAFARALSQIETDTETIPLPTKTPGPTGQVTKARGLGMTPESTIAVPRRVPREEAWLRGRELFFASGDTRISRDGRACASCHVDGRDDGITWDTPMGPRRTRTLAGQLESGPYGWRGEHPTLEAHVKVTFKQLGGKGLPDDELAMLVTYVRAMPKPPARSDGSRVADAARGKALFTSAECNSCHGGAAGDRNVHDVGTGGAFVTPTLASIGARKELMHDGRYTTLDDLLLGAKSMGAGSTLSPEDRRALVAYLETL